MDKKIKVAGALAGTFLAGIAAGNLIMPSTKDLIQRVLEPPTKIVSSADPSEQVEESQSMAIIVNGLGDPSFYSVEHQEDTTRAALVAYNVLASKMGNMNVQIFLSNPHGVEVPRDVQVTGPAIKDKVLEAIKDDILKQGRLYLVFLDSPSRDPITTRGITEKGWEDKPYLQLCDGDIYAFNIRDILFNNPNHKKIVILGNLDNYSFSNGLDRFSYGLTGLKNNGPGDLLALMFNFYDSKGRVSLIDMLNSYQKDPTQSFEQIIQPYMKGGSYFNAAGLRMDPRGDSDFSKPFLNEVKKESPNSENNNL